MKSASFGVCIFSPGLSNKSIMKQSKHLNGITKKITVFSKDDISSLHLLQKSSLHLFTCATLIYWEPLIRFSPTVKQSRGGQRRQTKQTRALLNVCICYPLIKFKFHYQSFVFSKMPPPLKDWVTAPASSIHSHAKTCCCLIQLPIFPLRINSIITVLIEAQKQQIGNGE